VGATCPDMMNHTIYLRRMENDVNDTDRFDLWCYYLYSKSVEMMIHKRSIVITTVACLSLRKPFTIVKRSF
jgi:hypothetical protein